MTELRERVERTLDQAEAHIRDRSFSYASAAIANAKELLALLDGGERPEPVAWRRWEQSKYGEGWIYYETPAWPDAEPLYASPAGRTPVSEGPSVEGQEEVRSTDSRTAIPSAGAPVDPPERVSEQDEVLRQCTRCFKISTEVWGVRFLCDACALKPDPHEVGWLCLNEHCGSANLNDTKRCWNCGEYHGSAPHQRPFFSSPPKAEPVSEQEAGGSIREGVVRGWITDVGFDDETETHTEYEITDRKPPGDPGAGLKATLFVGDWVERVSEASALRDALEGLVRYVDNQTCSHEEVHRGGFIWTICDMCGRKWADDEGGMPEPADPPEVATARRALEDTKGETDED